MFLAGSLSCPRRRLTNSTREKGGSRLIASSIRSLRRIAWSSSPKSAGEKIVMSRTTRMTMCEAYDSDARRTSDTHIMRTVTQQCNYSVFSGCVGCQEARLLCGAGSGVIGGCCQGMGLYGFSPSQHRVHDYSTSTSPIMTHTVAPARVLRNSAAKAQNCWNRQGLRNKVRYKDRFRA